MRPETAAIHAGSVGAEGSGATAVPVYQTVAYAYRTAEELADVFGGRASGYIYTRIANPTTSALETTLAEMEQGIGCIATSSGMAAITSVVMGLVRAGDEIVAAAGIFGGTISLFENVLRRFEVRTRLVEAGAVDALAQAINERTRLIFVETIGNPRMDVPDIRAIAEVAHQANLPLVVDNTVTTPILIRPGGFGADIVVHSTSKFINGHGTAIGGAIIDTGNYDWRSGPFPDIQRLSQSMGRLAFLSHLRNLICRDLGGCPAPVNSFLMLQGLETLSLRMARHCTNAESLARFLSGHPKVSWVSYPGLPESPYFELAGRQFGGRGGGLLTFSLGSRDRAFRFIAALKLARNMANLGDAKTLVIHPASTIFHEFGPEELRQMRIHEDMIRVSAGIEDFEDIREDFQQAIEQSSRT
jgi:O-acetylhomoserine (thiol)-lyase